MSRYIDAEIFGFIHFKDRPDKTYADGIQRVMAFVDSLPSADVRENARGNWVHRKTWDRYVCNKCSFEQPLSTNFCPNCGADMRGGNE